MPFFSIFVQRTVHWIKFWGANVASEPKFCFNCLKQLYVPSFAV